MTALNYYIDPHAVAIVTDTQVSDDDSDRTPLGSATKIFPMPHLDGVICGTGLVGLTAQWMVTLASQGLVADDMIGLDAQVPDVLKELAQQLETHFGMKLGDPPYTATVYHFGWDADEEEFVGFAYRSTQGFESERLVHGWGIKPPTAAIDAGEFPGIDDLADLIPIMHQQKKEDDAKTGAARVGIGGDIHLFTMTSNQNEGEGEGPVQMHLRRWARF